MCWVAASPTAYTAARAVRGAREQDSNTAGSGVIGQFLTAS